MISHEMRPTRMYVLERRSLPRLDPFVPHPRTSWDPSSKVDPYCRLTTLLRARTSLSWSTQPGLSPCEGKHSYLSLPKNHRRTSRPPSALLLRIKISPAPLEYRCHAFAPGLCLSATHPCGLPPLCALYCLFSLRLCDAHHFLGLCQARRRAGRASINILQRRV
ncbi:hypothetical protein FKP32DRAFT_1460353 [Trametes sanguinea]|nr:hypothetical protein FKP32DRAFT_1460353 [Trametes sanguinea]